MNAATVDSLYESLDRLQKWKPHPITLKVAQTVESDLQGDIDLMATISDKWPFPHSKRLWFQKEWNECGIDFRQKHIYPTVYKACRDAGFEVVASWDSNNGKVIFKCARGLKARTRAVSTSTF
jgi:hypothetical protein